MTLKQKTFSAGRWTAASAMVTSGLQIMQVAILARLLLPADFGLMAVTASILAVLGLFADLGLSRAIIHFENIPTNALHSLYWLNLIMGGTLSICFAVTAPWISHIFKLEGLSAVLISTSPFFFLSALGQQYCALAEKEFRFSDLAKKEIISATVGFATAATIAIMGGGVYALVGALLASTIVGSFVAWSQISMGYQPKLHFMLSETRPYIRYGKYLVGESFLNTLLRQADIFIASLFSSPTTVGMFSTPRDLSLRIGMIVNPIVTRVGFPVMSRLQGDTDALRSVYMHTLRMTASVNFPIYIALAIFSNEIVALLYGPQWRDSAVYLRILATWGLIRSTGNPVGSLLHAVGAVKLAFWWNVVSLALIVPIYWIATNNWSLSGLGLAMVATHIILVPLMWRFLVRPTCEAGFVEYINQLFIPLLLSLIAGFCAWLLTHEVSHGTLRLLIGCSTGGLIYMALSRILNRQWFDAVWLLLRLPSQKHN